MIQYDIYSALKSWYSQLNLSHCAITKKIMGETKDNKENLRSTRSCRKTMGSVLRKEKEESMVGMIAEKERVTR